MSLLRKLWVFGPLFGFLIAVIVTLVVTVSDWVENPSGIFHGPDGTNWQFVYDTAASWFLPTFVNATILATTLLLLWSGLRFLLERFSNRSPRDCDPIKTSEDRTKNDQ